MSISFKQKIIVFLSVVLAVLLFFAPKIPSEAKKNISEGADFAESFETVLKGVPAKDPTKALLENLRKEFLKAQADNKEQSWFSFANDFFNNASQIQDSLKAILYKGAIFGFQKVLELNPANLDAKAKLGASFVESSSLLGNPPMKGITLLREVVAQDSTNIEANFQLGLFSVSSQQFDKAIERFNRILRTDSTQIDMYAYLGDTYMQMGDKSKAIESLENYKNRVKDTLQKRNIDNYIKKIKIN